MSTYWALTVCPALYSALQILHFISPSWPPCKFYKWPFFYFQETKPWRDGATHPKSQLLSGRLQQAWIPCCLLHSPWAKPPCRADIVIVGTMATGVVRKGWDRDLRIWANRRGWQQILQDTELSMKRDWRSVWGGKIVSSFTLKIEKQGALLSLLSLPESSSLKKKYGFLSIPDDFQAYIPNPRHCSL